MTAEYFFDLAVKGGAYVAPFLLAALYWLARDRARLLLELQKKSEKLESLAERMIILMTELKGILGGKRTRS